MTAAERRPVQPVLISNLKRAWFDMLLALDPERKDTH